MFGKSKTDKIDKFTLNSFFIPDTIVINFSLIQNFSKNYFAFPIFSLISFKDKLKLFSNSKIKSHIMRAFPTIFLSHAINFCSISPHGAYHLQKWLKFQVKFHTFWSSGSRLSLNFKKAYQLNFCSPIVRLIFLSKENSGQEIKRWSVNKKIK